MRFLYKGKEISEKEIERLSIYERCLVQREEDNGDRWRPWRDQGNYPPLPPGGFDDVDEK